MNERIKELALQAGLRQRIWNSLGQELPMWQEDPDNPGLEKFAELIVRECAEKCLDMKYVDPKPHHYSVMLKEHFGVEEPQTQPAQDAAAFIAAENKKVASRYGYFPKLHPSEWKD
jgi:hypothetical protein